MQPVCQPRHPLEWRAGALGRLRLLLAQVALGLHPDRDEQPHERLSDREYQILRMIGDASAVDDLVQEVFIAAFSALSTFRREAQLDTWLYTIAANKVRNWWDSRRRREVREHHAAREPKDDPTTPEESLENDERLDRFYSVLGQLPHKLREAFVCRALEN